MRIIITTQNALEREFMTTFPEEQQQRIFERYEQNLTREKTDEMFMDICEIMSKSADADPVIKAEMDEWTPLDRLAWIVKEAYIQGAIEAFGVMAEANAMGVKAIAKGSRKHD